MNGGDLGTTAVIAMFLVPIVSLVKRPNWSTKVNYVLGMVAALIAAIAGMIVDNHGKTWRELIPQFGVAFSTSQVVYNMYFANTTVNAKLTGV